MGGRSQRRGERLMFNVCWAKETQICWFCGGRRAQPESEGLANEGHIASIKGMMAWSSVTLAISVRQGTKDSWLSRKTCVGMGWKIWG